MSIIPLANGFYVSESKPISNQECINLYPVTQQVKSLNQDNLIGTPGINSLTSTGLIEQVNRGSIVKNDIPYFINGTSLYRVDKTIVDEEEVFSTTDLGTIEGTERLSLASNGTQIMILIPGGTGYIYNEDSTATNLVEITDLDFRANGNPLYVVFINGYFICTTDEDKIINSSLKDGLTWDALDFASVESDPDSVVAPVVLNNQLWITGTITTEGFQSIQQTGVPGFPFQRNNVFLDKGCIAPHSIIKANQSFFMLGRGENETVGVWKLINSSYQKISSIAIDILLQSYTNEQLSNVFSVYYGDKGQFFVCFILPDTTIVFDLLTNKWHERKSREQEETTRWRVNSLVYAYDRLLVGDMIDGRIGELNKDTFTEYDVDIIRTFSLEPFAKMDGFSIPYLEITMESGVGNTDCPDPQIALSISRDGKIFGPPKNRGIGKTGEFQRRIVWRRNGRVKRFSVIRFRMSDPVKAVFIKLEAK